MEVEHAPEDDVVWPARRRSDNTRRSATTVGISAAAPSSSRSERTHGWQASRAGCKSTMRGALVQRRRRERAAWRLSGFVLCAVV